MASQYDSNVVVFEVEREKRLKSLVESGDFVSMYYLGKLYEDRGEIDEAMKLYMKSSKGSDIANKDLGKLIHLYERTYRRIRKEI